MQFVCCTSSFSAYIIKKKKNLSPFNNFLISLPENRIFNSKFETLKM